MPNKFLPRCAPIWGFPSHFTIADLAPSYQPNKIPLIENVTADQTSSAIALGARGVRMTLTLEVPTATCDITLISVIAGVDTPVKTWIGATYSTEMYAGNLEMVDLQGLPVKVAVSNLSAGWVSVFALVTQ